MKRQMNTPQNITPSIQFVFDTRLPPLRSGAIGWPFTVQNLEQRYVLVSFALPNTRHNITDKVLDVKCNGL